MGFRFHKSIKIAPGVKLNIGKKSMGVSVGNKFGGVSYNTKTGAHARASVPGTGISYTEKIGGSPKAKRSYDPEITGNGSSENTGMPPKRGRNYQMWFKIIRWAFVVIFSAVTVGTFPSIASFIFLAAAFLAAPIDSFDAFVRDKLHIGSKIKIAIVIVLFIAGGATMPQTEKAESPDINSSISQESEQSKAETQAATPAAEAPETNKSDSTQAGTTGGNNKDSSAASSVDAQSQEDKNTVTSNQTEDTSNTPEDAAPATEAPQQTAPAPAQDSSSQSDSSSSSESSSGSSTGAFATEGKFVASSEGGKYHYPSCRAAKKILDTNRIWFNSAEDAESAGYGACGICDPG